MEPAVVAEVVEADAVEADVAAGVLTLRGSIVGGLAEVLLTAARSLPEEQDVEVRCAALVGLDAAALGVLLALRRAREGHGKRVTCLGVVEPVATLLRVTGASAALGLEATS